VEEYGKIIIKNIYPGIDWVLYTNSKVKDQPLKYDFIVHPGGDYHAIQFKFLNANEVNLKENDSKLSIQCLAGTIEEGKLFSYQESENNKVQSNYHIDNDSIISFKIGVYDTTKILVIDPLVWATYYGGSGMDYNSYICVDNQDNMFITGQSYSTNFPIQFLTAAYNDAINSYSEIFILKFNNLGIRQWATYYGGSNFNMSRSMCIDHQGNLYITGCTKSTDFPTQQLSGAYNQPLNGGLLGNDVFILKFNNQGQRLWATYYGGEYEDWGYSIKSDSLDNIFITGCTASVHFPTQQSVGAYWQTGYAEAYILKFNNQGVRQWATYYGSNYVEGAYSMCIDSQNNIYITGYATSQNFPTHQLAGAYWQSFGGGYDVFIAKFSNLGQLLWSTFYGGSSDEYAYSICADSQDNIYITGEADSSNFPVQQMNGAYWQTEKSGIFILKFNNQGQRQWASFYGKNGWSFRPFVITDKQDNLYITGSTTSETFPLQSLTTAYNQSSKLFGSDAFILKFNNQCVRQWATYCGSSSNDYGVCIAVDNQNSIYFTGEWWGSGAFTKDYGNGAYYENISNGGSDNYILKILFCNVEAPISASCNRNNFCASDNGAICLTATGGEGNLLKWYTGGCGQNYIGSGVNLTIASPSQTTTYYARWESCDTALSSCVSVTVNVDTTTTSPPIMAISNRTNFCANDSADIVLTASGGRGDKLRWYNNGCGQNYIGSDTLTIASPAQTTTYYARWENNCDTSACVSSTVNVYPLPSINLGNDNYICEEQRIELIAGSGFSSYLWQDGSNNHSFNVTKPGKYWLSVGQNNCYNSDTINFLLCEPPLNFWIPNAFTPDGDGHNDFFKVESVNKFKDFHLYIYNRWGQLFFETKDINKAWDGKYKGSKVPSAVYVWKLFYSWEGSFGETLNGEKDGTVTLLR
jgi:gliding motility-associated-like protein